MNAKDLLTLGFDHWEAILLSLIPALVTLFLIIHIHSNFPSYRMNRIYLLFLFAMFVYQINDTVARMSQTVETARSWDRLLAIFWAILAPSGLHWALLLTRKRKLLNTSWFIILIYFSAVFFTLPLISGLYSQPFIYSSFWGWVRTYKNVNSFVVATLVWWCLVFTSMLFLFAEFAYRNRNSPDLKFVSLMNFIGFSIPTVIGIAMQVVLPLLFNIAPVPITSMLMLTTGLVIIGLNAYKIFNLSETLDTERITEITEEVIFVVTPKRTINYINSCGLKLIEEPINRRPALSDLFSNIKTLNAFEEQVLTPSFRSKIPTSFQFSMTDRNGKRIHWEVMAYQVFKRGRLESMLIMCRDITDRVIVAETRLAALRTQMNPHFIFNSLNSIQYYIHTFQREMAESFLSTFSMLIRKILDNSVKITIPLSEEIHTIELYLQLEKARFGNKLNYEICVAESIDRENTLVPSMLIQPYIENAILHGLGPKEEDGKLTIDIKDEKDCLLCIVKDNGVGRQKGIELKSLRTIKRTSYGMSITEARLSILNQNLKIPVSVRIIDLMSVQNEPAGTQVEIYIPVNERF